MIFGSQNSFLGWMVGFHLKDENAEIWVVTDLEACLVGKCWGRSVPQADRASQGQSLSAVMRSTSHGGAQSTADPQEALVVLAALF